MRLVSFAFLCLVAAVIFSSPGLHPGLAAEADAPADLKFAMREIESGLDIGYAVLLVDVNGDGKTGHRRRRYARASSGTRTRPGSGAPSSRARPSPTTSASPPTTSTATARSTSPSAPTGSRSTPSAAARCNGSSAARRSTSRGRCTPSARSRRVHRIRFADIDGSGKPALLVGAAHGPRQHQGEELDGRLAGARARATASRRTRRKDRWVPEVLDESLHVVHNFWPIPRDERQGRRTC